MDLGGHLGALDPRPLDCAAVGPYRGYTELVAAWAALCERGARARRIGGSVHGVPLWALEVGPEDAARVSVVMAGVHPIEWIGVEAALALLERLVARPPSQRRVLVFPLVNVDGYRAVESDLRAGRRRFRRSNARGVDLNRNFPTHFRARPPRRGLARVLGGWNHGGEAPLSEPEAAAVAATLDGAGARIDRALSLHSIGKMILVPWGGRLARPQAGGDLLAAAEAVRARLPGYRVVQSSRWVPGLTAHGMELDHLHARYGALTLLVECTRGGARLTEPSSWLHPFRWFNPPDPGTHRQQIADALEPFVRG